MQMTSRGRGGYLTNLSKSMNEKLDYKKVNKFWDKSAVNSAYDDDIQTGMMVKNKLSAQYRKYREEEHFSKIIKFEKGMNVLEIGCGTGRWAFYMAPKVKQIVAVDSSENMINIARNKQKKRDNHNIKFYCGSACEFDTNTRFDVVYFSGVLEYIMDNDVNSILNKVPGWLKNGGVCASRDTISRGERVVEAGDYPVIFRTREEHIKMFAENNLYLRYNEKSYNLTMSAVASAYFLNRFFPDADLRTVIKSERLLKPSEGFLRYVLKHSKNPKWRAIASDISLTHNFFLFRQGEG